MKTEMSDKIKEAMISVVIGVVGFFGIGGGAVLMAMAMNPATWR